MFQKIHQKLAFICCFITTCIVMLVILICLFFSERNMYNEEEAFLLLKTNSISFDLISSHDVDMLWYAQSIQQNNDILYIEVNGTPSTFSSLMLTDTEKDLIQEIQNNITNEKIKKITHFLPEYTYNSKLEQEAFKYTDSKKHDYMVMSSHIIKGSTSLNYLYLHSLDSFKQRVFRQRIGYFFICLISIALLYIFSFYFTALVLKPLIRNHEKQKQFIALSSHELRSPLAVFKTGLSILRSSPEPDKANHFFDILEEEIKRMEHLINDLLFLSKAEQSTVNYEFKPVNLPVLLSSTYDKYLPIAEEKQILFSLDMKKFGDLWCICDSQRIEQVIIILLDNALTYTPQGGTITLGLDTSRTKHLIYVRDTGSGISNSEKEKIFDKFYQANASHNTKNHFGLGLSIAKAICHAHKGNITVSDTNGGGSTFTISLPVSKNLLN